MRRFLIFATFTVLILILLGALTGYVMAQDGPFRPGDGLFKIQNAAEIALASLIPPGEARVGFYLRLADRRVDDLVLDVGAPNEALTFSYLDQSLNRLLLALSELTDAEIIHFHEPLSALVDKMDIPIKASLSTQRQFPTVYLGLKAKIDGLRALLGSEVAAASQLGEIVKFASQLNLAAGDVNPDGDAASQTIQPQAVAFPPGSPGALHTFFPLTGKHSVLKCENCHTTGIYTGTLKLCESCHSDVKPQEHFPGDCAICHTPDDWVLVSYDHSLAEASDCVTCHLFVKPADHYKGNCSACHSTSAWKPANFDHKAAGATQCLTCHTRDKPANHYTGVCSACHSTNDWLPASFNHRVAGATNCSSCHNKDKPVNHYTAQCSACHGTAAWKPATFNHQAVGATDCTGCHSNKKPTNHYNGQCSACHSTKAWKPANFNHKAAGATDCISCHSNNKPSNHFDGQCSKCHSTDAWKPANFNHTAGADCKSCHSGDRPSNHFDGQCSSCHSTNAWKPANFNHTGQTDCQSCHSAPSNHWSGKCTKCHNTTGWHNISVDGHSFPTNHGNADGKCSSCHEGTNSNVSCYKCHDRQKMEEHHNEKGITDIANRCLSCHPNGKKGD